MSNVRDYLKEREKRLGVSQPVNYKDKIKSHKLTILYRAALVIVLIAAVAVFLVVQWKNKVFSESVVVSSTPVTIVQGAMVENLGGNILLYSKDGASCIDAKGNALWNQTFEMQEPMLSVCNNVAAIGDYNGRTVYVVSSTGQLGTVNTNLPIRKICVSQSGVVAAVLDDAEVTRILLYNGNENTDTSIVDIKATMDKSGYPMSLSLSPNGKLLAISYLHVNSGEMKSSVAFFNFGEVGKNESDNYVSGYDYPDTVIPYVQFMNNSAAFAVSDDRIVFFEGGEKPANKATALLNEEVQGIYYNEDYVGLVFHNQTGESAYRLDVYNTAGTKIHSQLFDMEYTDIIFSRDQVIIYNDMDCKICNMSGVDKFTGTFEKPSSLLVPTSSNYKYVSVTSNSVDVIELK
ncbi:MAG: DUF5711 family protein [Lachnospiraceae bacterium]|nr:DUF5711 family protein [Lachnospiraceae bacterium]MCI7190728.1 DUF5711 family protein [Lachnospiraceae bacterium]MDD7629060.1 DUF5711 family protein [Lachnospiraceae bacterium]MDY4117734.1 DUF5711 family protein [Lachnospiraceae bacterium]